MTLDLTKNELKAALILLDECLGGMGGEKPEDLEHDEYTWVTHDMLKPHGWTEKQAQGVFGSLVAKGVVFEADKDEYALDGWRELTGAWHEREVTKAKEEEEDPYKATDYFFRNEDEVKNFLNNLPNGLSYYMFFEMGLKVDTDKELPAFDSVKLSYPKFREVAIKMAQRAERSKHDAMLRISLSRMCAHMG